MNVVTSPRSPKIARRLGSALAVVVVAGTVLTGCASGSNASSSSTSSSKAGSSSSKTLTVGISGDPSTLDPGNASESIANELIKNTYLQWEKYGTTKQSGKDYSISDVTKIIGEAASYSMSSDKKVATFTIPASAKFPSGNPITSDDFIYTVNRALSTKLGPVFIFNTAGITSVSQIKKISDKKFTITLPSPSPMFGELLRDQDASVLDATLIEKHKTASDPWSTKWLAQNNIGGGAYTLASYSSGNQIVLKKNPNYVDAKSVQFKKVILRIIPSESERSQLLASGTLDIAEGLSVDSAASLKSTKGVKVLDIPSRSQDVFGFVQTFKPFANVKVREALAHAIDYKSLAKNVGKGYAEAPKGLWPQNSASFAKSVSNNPLTTNLSKAKSMLKAAGYPNGFSFTVQVSTADSTGQSLAVAVQSQLSQIGVTMKISQLAPATFSANLSAKSGDAFVETGSLSYVDDPYYSLFLFYTSSANLNYWDLKDSTIDSIADELKTTTGTAARQKLAAKAQKELNAQVPNLVLMEPDYVLAMRSDIKGFVLEPDDLIRFGTLRRG